MMSMTVTIPKLSVMQLRTAGLEAELDRLLTADAIRNSNAAATAWRAVAAVDTGWYRGSITPKVRKISGIIQAIASTNVRSANGFPYPRALEDSSRYHYRRTSRKGQQTAGQVAKVAKTLAPKVRADAKKTTGELIKTMVIK